MKQEIRQINMKVLPKQLEFLQSQASEVLYSGAAGAGKTRALCIKAILKAQYPGNVVGLFRKTRVSLKQTTLRTLLKPDGHLPPVLPPGTYTHNKADGVITLNNGGEIIYGGFDDELKLASLGLGTACIDEGLEIGEEEYDMLITRLRNTADPCPQMAVVTNPGTPSHYLFKRFIGPEADMSRREVIHTNSHENFFLRKEFFQYLDSLTGTTRKRLVEGQWVSMAGLVFGDLQQERRNDFGPEPRYLIGVDAGFHHPHALLIVIPDNDRPPHVLDEIRGSKWTIEFFAKQIKNRWAKDANLINNNIGCYVDPSCPELIEELRVGPHGIAANKADNDVLPGISAVIRLGPTISPGCEELIREINSYQWDTTEGMEDRPIKKNDHGPDALRYALYTWDDIDRINWSAFVT